MAYQEKELKIYPGGLNLLPPGDQVAEGDCLDLTDWWPGSAGRLEQAPELTALAADPIFGKDTLLQADGRIYGAGNGDVSDLVRGVFDTGYDGYPLGVISMNGYAWFMNRAKATRDNGTVCVFWWIGNPDQGLTLTALPGQGGLGPPAANQYEYFITWVIAGLGETNPGPVAPLTVDPGSAIQCQRPADGDEPAGATGWNIYRQNYIDTDGIPLFGTVYLVNPVPIPIDQLIYIDYGDVAHNQDDTSIRELGVIMEVNHDPPPPARITANQTYNGRIVVANSAAHPNRVWYTNALQPAYFPGSGDPNLGNWVDIGTDKGDQILAIAVRPKTLVIYRERSIWRLLGDFGDPNARIEPIVPELGIAGPRAMVSTSTGDYFVASANRGFYYFNNDWAQKISQKTDPIFRGQPTENFPTLGDSYQSQVAVGYRDGRVWISYPLTDGFPAGSLIYHVESQRWFFNPGGYGAFLDTGDRFLGVNGSVVALEDAYSGGSTILAFQSQYHDCGLPDHEKTWADLVIQHNTQGSTLTITIRLNKNADPATNSFTLATFTSNAMTKDIFPLVYPGTYPVVALRGQPISSYSLSVRITGPGADDAPVVIDGPILLHYYLEARRAKTFDTAPSDMGTPLVKIVDQVEHTIDASAGDADLQIYSDIPGGVLVSRLSPDVVIAQTQGREVRRTVLPSPIAGRLLRERLTTDSDMRVYGVRARILPIGVYLDGTIADFWQPEPISIGV